MENKSVVFRRIAYTRPKYRKYMIDEQQQEIDRQREELAEKNLQLEQKDLQINQFADAQKNAIKNMLYEHMGEEKIASLLGCDISYVEQIKAELNL